MFLLHAVAPGDYEVARDRLRPALERAREAGKVGHIGLTETAPNDPRHATLERALADGGWEVAMLAFHMMNQNARRRVFPAAMAGGVGTLIMFAVRAIFSDPAYLARTMAALAAEGKIPAEPGASGRPLDFLIRPGRRGEASSTPPTATRATSRAPMWCCSAPARLPMWKRMWRRSCVRRCRASTGTGWRTGSEHSKGSASTCRGGANRCGSPAAGSTP